MTYFGGGLVRGAVCTVFIVCKYIVQVIVSGEWN